MTLKPTCGKVSMNFGTCPICGKVFERAPRQSSRRFCSHECWYQHKRESGKKAKERICKQCGKLFTVKRPSMVGIYCSYACLGKSKSVKTPIATCKNCGKMFSYKPAGDRKKTYCSRACYDVDTDKKKRPEGPYSRVYKQCELCGKTFHGMKTIRFCSKLCADTSRRGSKISTRKQGEVIRTYRPKRKNGVGRRSCTDVFVPTGKFIAEKRGLKIVTRRVWKRKAVVVLESVLGKKLTSGEAASIVFIDGDRLNCSINNLMLTTSKTIVICSVCGRSVVKYISSADSGSITCVKCQASFSQLNPNAKLSVEDVACIRGTVKYHSEFWPRVMCHDGKIVRYGQTLCLSIWFSVHVSTISCVFSSKTWQGVTAMAAKDTWKVLLKQHDLLKKKATASVYDRVKLLALVWENPSYLEDCRKNGKSPGEDMNARVNDTCANWTELFQMLKMFPNKKEWTNGDLSKMRMDMLNKLREQQNGKKEKKPRKKVENRRTATLTEVRDLEAERNRLKSDLENANKIIKGLQVQVSSLTDQLGGYRATVDSLNATIKLLQGKGKGKAAISRKREVVKS